MQYMILGAALGLLFSIFGVWAYERGLRAGMRQTRGIEPEPIKGPVTVIAERKQAKVAKAETDRLAEGMRNIFSYNGDPQPKGGEK